MGLLLALEKMQCTKFRPTALRVNMPGRLLKHPRVGALRNYFENITMADILGPLTPNGAQEVGL